MIVFFYFVIYKCFSKLCSFVTVKHIEILHFRRKYFITGSAFPYNYVRPKIKNKNISRFKKFKCKPKTPNPISRQSLCENYKIKIPFRSNTLWRWGGGERTNIYLFQGNRMDCGRTCFEKRSFKNDRSMNYWCRMKIPRTQKYCSHFHGRRYSNKNMLEYWKRIKP